MLKDMFPRGKNPGLKTIGAFLRVDPDLQPHRMPASHAGEKNAVSAVFFILTRSGILVSALAKLFSLRGLSQVPGYAAAYHILQRWKITDSRTVLNSQANDLAVLELKVILELLGGVVKLQLCDALDPGRHPATRLSLPQTTPAQPAGGTSPSVGLLVSRRKAPAVDFCLASGGCKLEQTRPWLGLVDLSRIPSGTFFREVHPGSEMASQNDQNKAKRERKLSNHDES